MDYYPLVTAKQLKTAVKQLFKFLNPRILVSHTFEVCAKYQLDRLRLSWISMVGDKTKQPNKIRFYGFLSLDWVPALVWPKADQ